MKSRRSEATEPRLIGLTGGIASGKSTVARFFAEAGIPVLDADLIARGLREEGGRAHPLIVKRFGTADRAKLREIVFSDPQARKDLEAILHPLIQEESLAEAKRLSRPGLPVIYEAALLVETGRYQTFEGLIVVQAPREERIRRLMERDGSTRELAEKILSSQLSDDERRKAATYVIDNHGDLESLRTQVEKLATELRAQSVPSEI